MASNQKPKTGKTRNDARNNGKAVKKNPGKVGGVGSSRTRMDPLTLILLGKGAYQKTANRAHRDALADKSRARSKPKSDKD